MRTTTASILAPVAAALAAAIALAAGAAAAVAKPAPPPPIDPITPVAGDAGGGATIATDPVEPAVAPVVPLVVAPAPPPLPPRPIEIVDRDPLPPPRPPRPVPRNAIVLGGSALTARMPEGAGRIADLGRGAALSIGLVPRRCDCPVGVTARAMFLGGEDSRVYALDVQMLATPALGRKPIAPFMSVGIGFGTVRFAEAKQASVGLALGPAGSLGVHGFLTHALYWRAEVGAIGAGGAVVVGGASLGWMIGS